MEQLVTRMNNVLSSLDIDAHCINAEQNRHLAFFDVQLGNATRIRKLELFSREISIGLRSENEPIITPMPKKGIVRFRVAMDRAETAEFHTLYNKHINTRPDGVMPFLLGENDEGKPLWLDMASNPHMLAAGETGSGKSCMLHVLIANAYKRDDVDLTLIDPKFGVEFLRYADRADVARDYDEAIMFLELIEEQMNNRYKKMVKYGVSSLDSSPSLFKKKLVIIDEVADLMLYDSNKKNPNRGRFEELLCGIAQKSRAAGIYMVIATQRPSVDIITGAIKANFPARLACKVSTATDSKVILDHVGAESLLGRGDAILNNSKHNNVRFQVAYVDVDNQKKSVENTYN